MNMTLPGTIRTGCPCLILIAISVLLAAGCRGKTPSAGDGSKANGSAGVRDNSQSGSSDQSTAVSLQGWSREQFQAAQRLQSRGTGHLENKEWADAESALVQLMEQLPMERLSLKNLAISRALAILDSESPYSRADDPERYRAAYDSAMKSAVQLEQQFADEKPLAMLIRGRLLAFGDGPDQSTIREAISVLRDAARESGDQPDYWFAVAMAMDGHRDYADSAELLQVLEKCFQLAPRNLFVLHKLLLRQALGLNARSPDTRSQAASLPETLQVARELLLPLQSSILNQRRFDVIQTIDTALSGLAGSELMQLMGPTMNVTNLVLPELSTQIDRRKIDRNLLDYLLQEFGAEFQQAARTAGAMPTIQPSVVQGFELFQILPELSGVTDLDVADMNLDGHDNLIVAASGRIQVYGRSSAGSGDWELMMESPANSGSFSRFLLVDIDRDFDRVLSDVRAPALLRDADGDRRMVRDVSDQQRWFDTDLDVVAWDSQGAQIFRNDITESGERQLTLLPQQDSPRGIFQIVAADLEADGDLDLIAATSDGLTIWRNIDGTQFDIVTDGIAAPEYPVHGLAIGDWNRDVAMDVVGVSADGPAGILQNMLHNRFRWVADAEEISAAEPATIVRIGDFDGNLSWDLLAAGPNGIQVHFTALSSNGVQTSLRQQILTQKPVSAVEVADLDNDGWVDVVALGESGVLWFRGSPEGEFQEVTGIWPSEVQETAWAAVRCVDYDDDGDLDVLLASAETGRLTVLLNQGGNTNNWLQVVARAVGDDPQFPSNRVNMHGIGSVIELKSGTAYQAQIVNRPRLHLGMGQATSADALRVIWTDGIPQNVVTAELLRPRVGILAPQILKGSCPYIYTWNGSRFEFFSDCLWAAPIGLVQASGDLAPTREWEYLLIPGKFLQPKDGQYVVQLTEELWEAAYFDHVELLAVDHPADVSIFTNEKVGSASMAAHRIHTVRNRRLPRRVVDGAGRDLLPGLAAQDGDYVQAFQQRVLQGLTDPWVMEFEPGLDVRPADLRLVLIGWVFPTDTSLNEAIRQNPQLAAPAPPALEVRNADGQWVVAKPFIGFPSGKTKAMVVDLSDAFISEDMSFRITSSMELYWDAAFLIVDEQTAETRVRECALESADLHYRGFSRRVYGSQSLFRNGGAPEDYDYDSVTLSPRWPAMQGRFTRYGDATELLRTADDRLIVMGPGDELTVKFAVPAEDPPEGWTRSFVLYNVGWDKDADLNTVYGQSSEPYPFRSMTQYPVLEQDILPDSAEYIDYLSNWQTREYSMRHFWRQVRDADPATPPSGLRDSAVQQAREKQAAR